MKRNHSHPGIVLLEQFLRPSGLSQNALARDIGVPPRRINEIILGKRGITAFIVDTKAPGYIVSRIEKKMGQNASDTCEIQLENVVVSAEDRLGDGPPDPAVHLSQRVHHRLSGGRGAEPVLAGGAERRVGLAGRKDLSIQVGDLDDAEVPLVGTGELCEQCGGARVGELPVGQTGHGGQVLAPLGQPVLEVEGDLDDIDRGLDWVKERGVRVDPVEGELAT